LDLFFYYYDNCKNIAIIKKIKDEILLISPYYYFYVFSLGGEHRVIHTEATTGNIDSHLRNLSRQLIKFDTVDETLSYLLFSFLKRFNSNYVSIILRNHESFEIMASQGNADNFESKFPLGSEAFSSHFLSKAICTYNTINPENHCFFYDLLKENFRTWFIVPINDSKTVGLCVIGFEKLTPLSSSAQHSFEEFGKNLGSAIETAQKKEREKKKIEAIELLKGNVNLGISVEQLVKNITERAGRLTNAESAFIYLFDNVKNYFVFQGPSFGTMNASTNVRIEGDYLLKHYFPFIEETGHQKITIPLIVNLKTIGVLRVEKGDNDFFSKEDLELLQFLSSYFSILIDNARLYKNQLDDKSRLEKLMIHNQELVKQTLVGEGFDEITDSLSQTMGRTVLLFDRFMRLISQSLVGQSMEGMAEILDKVEHEKLHNPHTIARAQWIRIDSENQLCLVNISVGSELLGYLGIKIKKEEMDMFMRMTIDNALNVYAIQFIKQKLSLDLKEQEKGGFIHQLFAEKIEDKERLIEYANLFNLNIFLPNKIGVFSIEYRSSLPKDDDLLTIEAHKTKIWEKIRKALLLFDPSMMVTRKDGLYIVIVPEKNEKEISNYWGMLYKRMHRVMEGTNEFEIYLGISLSTTSFEDYFNCYNQALQALRIVCNRFPKKKFLSFESLGAYSVLNSIHDSNEARMFVNQYLSPLLHYGGGKAKGKDFFDTLRMYLMMNGNLKDTSEELYIHRSSLKYRLEKIVEILNVNIDDAEERFNLMLAYKLYDLLQS
jgi:sugar diacid utilization regulator